MGFLCCLCVEKVITIDSQVLHADMTETSVTISSPPSAPSFSPSIFITSHLPPSPSFRLAKFHQIPRGPDRHLGRCRVICVPGHRWAQTQNHLDEERQESQLTALWGEHPCVSVRSLKHSHTHRHIPLTVFTLSTHLHSTHNQLPCYWAAHQLFSFLSEPRQASLLFNLLPSWFISSSSSLSVFSHPHPSPSVPHLRRLSLHTSLWYILLDLFPLPLLNPYEQ